MKNILLVISSLQSGGGAEKVCSTIGTKLQEKGYNIHFLTFYDAKEKYSFKGQYFSLNEKLSNKIFINLFKLFKRAWQIKKYCKNNKISTSISFMEEANFCNIFSKIIFGNRSKVNISIRQSISIYSKLYKFLIKNLYNFADKIIPIVKEEKENLIKNYGIKKEKIQNIYNPVDIKKINKLKLEVLGEDEKYFNNGKFTFINAGRLTYQKNQELLINVFKKFNIKYKNSQLIILGEGELRKELENQIGNNKNIHLLGLRKNPYKYMYNSDFFVFSSRYEGMPGVLLESLACGLPIISTDCPTGPKEILRKYIKSFDPVNKMEKVDYGILVPINNKEELFKAMEKIYLDKKLRKEYSKKVVDRAKFFDLEKNILKWIAIFL